MIRAVARRLGVKSLVRNLEDGSVEIFAEAGARALERFLNLIEIKGRSDDLLSLHVDRVEVYREGEPGYQGHGGATGSSRSIMARRSLGP